MALAVKIKPRTYEFFMVIPTANNPKKYKKRRNVIYKEEFRFEKKKK